MIRMRRTDRTDRLRRHWNRQASGYDRSMGFLDRRLFRDTRPWICGQATGDVLEVAIGTGLNLPHYPPGVRLAGLELSPAMLAIARRRAADLGVPADLREGDAHELPFPDASVDTVVCTYALCAIPDEARAVHEMVRVLRPGGLLLLADHVVSTARLGRAVQRLAELVTVPLGQEHFRRRPLDIVRAAGLPIERHDRFTYGIVERLAARKPA